MANTIEEKSELTFVAENGARLSAELNDENRTYVVGLDDEFDGWEFDAEACEGAIEFFTLLKNRLTT